MIEPTYQLPPDWPRELAGYVIKLPDLMIGPASDGWQEYQDWLAAGNKPAPARDLLPYQEAQKRHAAGLWITSTSNSALNGTYATDPESQRTITSIYAGIRGGDGLPGDGTTFAYHDITGTPHLFTADEFAALAKVMRDYLYAFNLAAQQPSPIWPEATATLP